MLKILKSRVHNQLFQNLDKKIKIVSIGQLGEANIEFDLKIVIGQCISYIMNNS
jgi:hypothetical protein